MAFNCYARIYLRLGNNGIPLESNFGYYDLEIDSLNGTTPLPFDTHSQVTKPVFCFGNTHGAGTMKIFDDSKTTNVFTSPFLLCKYHFTASETKVDQFITLMQNSLQYVSGNAATGNYALYNATQYPFTTYTDEHINCFYATAFLCYKLGNSTLLSVYNQYNGLSNGYTYYSSWNMFNQYYQSWSITLLNR